MKRFYVKRRGKRQGHDRTGDWFGVYACGYDPADPNKGPVVTTLLTEIGGSLGSRHEAVRLADALRAAYDNWRKDQLGVKSPLFRAAQAAYHLLTTLSDVKPLSNAAHGKVVDDLSAALNEVDPTGAAILTGV